MKKILLFVSLFVLLLTSCTIAPGGGTIPTIKKYTVSFDSNGGTEVAEQIVEEGKLAIEPKGPTKENYDFIYWEYNNERYNFNTPVKSNITLVAKWQEKGIHEHNLIYHEKKEPTCTEIGCEEYVECSECTYSTYKELPALDHDLVEYSAKDPTKYEVGWKDYVACNRCDYTTYEEVPKLEVGYTDYEIYEENGYKYINFGSYPQTHVNDEALLSSLNSLTQTNERGYYEFEGKEYYKIKSRHFYYGALEKTDSEGNVISTTYPYKYSSGKIIMEYRSEEWFIVEPIKWRILSNDDNGTYQLLSEYILTGLYYYHANHFTSIDGESIAPNNYKYSDIRRNLNNSFYNSAFSASQKECIVITEVDNSINSTLILDDSYLCENTSDKIYLLSLKDIINSSYGFSNDVQLPSRKAKVTDYAKAKGCPWSISEKSYDIGVWWLRTPHHGIPYYAHTISVNGSDNTGTVNDKYYGVRPAMVIAINSIN